LPKGLGNLKSLTFLIRLFEKSGDRKTVAMRILSLLLERQKKGFEYGEQELWSFLIVIAEQVPVAEVHEQIMSFILKKLDKSMYMFSYSLTRLILLISKMRLCSSELYNRNCNSIVSVATNCPHEPEKFYFLVSVILEFNPTFQIGHSIYSIGALLIFQHKKQPFFTPDQVSCLVETFKKIVVDFTTKNSSSLIILDFIKEFGQEPYFNES
jgi:hypothetical protein